MTSKCCGGSFRIYKLENCPSSFFGVIYKVQKFIFLQVVQSEKCKRVGHLMYCDMVESITRYDSMCAYMVRQRVY